jgi:hypothetical protein
MLRRFNRKRYLQEAILAAVLLALGAIVQAAPQEGSSPTSGGRGALPSATIDDSGMHATAGGTTATLPPPPSRGGAALAGRGRGGAASPAPGEAGPPTGRGGPSGPFTAARPALALVEGPSCDFDATVYEIRLPPDQIGKIDKDALTKAAGNAADFEKELAKFGESRPLYRANQAIRLGGESYVQIGNNVAYITNSQITAAGQTINSVGYTSVGAIFDVVSKVGDEGMINIDLSVQVSTLEPDAGVPISANVNAPVFRRAILQGSKQVQPERPFVVVTADSTAPDKNGKAVAYMARITFGKPEGAATAPAAK